MNLLERVAMRWQARRELEAIVGERTPGSLARRAVERLSVRRHAVKALRSPLLPAAIGTAVLAGLALLGVGILVGLALSTPAGST